MEFLLAPTVPSAPRPQNLQLMVEEEAVFGFSPYQLVRKRKTVELEMKDANQKEINANTWGDNFILAGDSTLNEKWLLVLNDGKIVVEKAVKKYEGSRGIDSHTGMNHPLFYTAFNVAMSNYAKWVYFLDYHACKSEIKSIRELLSKNSSNTIPLPS